MLHTLMAGRGMVTAPHHLAARAGLRVLEEGGNAIEAMVAAAATSAVVYPHMTGLGGDGFWLVARPGRAPLSIEACGAAGRAVTPDVYTARGLDHIPRRGPLAANTVAGTVSGWSSALDISRQHWDGNLSRARLFEDAIYYAEAGVPMAESVADTAGRVADEMADLPHWKALFLEEGGQAPAPGAWMRNPALAQTLRRLAERGLDDFYRGDVGRAISADLKAQGSPLVSDDLASHRSVRRRPLALKLAEGTVYNTQPPTQGLASLMILGLFERLGITEAEGFDHIHGLLEATKCAYALRNRHVTDPRYMAVHPTTYLSDTMLDQTAATIDRTRAAPWPTPAMEGDTVWMGCVDGAGRAVSFIQSLFQGFGSGVVLPETGLVWQNRGIAFGLDPAEPNVLIPGRRPFHTLNPPMARLRDGSVLVYGTMGGDSQPQIQAQLFTRHVQFGQSLQAAVTAPRWLLGRDWSGAAHDVKVEARVDEAVVAALEAAGHRITRIDGFDELAGHAGAIRRRPDGVLEGATDPRADGIVAAF
ncbi:gamma-glutamyltransferase family protein [Roseospira marina]|uniref:Gamma-glutamyltransferase family protein n=1 Tax=Roseospira marina TaxID=140057 RepID=A0A5M6IGJ7_9PROT|nr:gamma-glutamyltransferase family protein [Roseospira marina]KAA5607282.1 gamma-glutamyltransferase family protein [Roseospira marina]MBB4312563.1 gamma-glutamyltranspeptidase/glutathione hydrolase [Roseospira marina]MBB5085421.1 gamma-glutamyltranspeptidase/glutathione hydrolase [Roseospira marina]